MKSSSKQEGHLIQDRPLANGDADSFGYGDIATNLVDIISRSPLPMTIGLFGQWGVGKSTICEQIRDLLKKNKDFETFYFDTWKYERDSFRRQFLIELDEDIFKGRFKYKSVLNQSLTLPYTPPLWEDIKRSFSLSVRTIFLRLFIPFILLVAALAILLGINSLIYPFLGANFASELKLIFETFTTLGFALYLAEFIFKSVKVFKGEVEIPRTDSAEGFEYYFKDILRALNKKKLLVIIDNLDRLDHVKAVEHLSDIKTFLANDKFDYIKNRTLFLIPCDNEALSLQLKQANKNLDTEEYLRKFFNVSFRIPRLLVTELDSYVEKQLKRTEVKDFIDNHSLSFVIGRAFQTKNNPRQIIQFINSLTTTYLLAKKRGLKIASTQKVPFLAKVLVIKLRWPEIYSQIETRVLRSAQTLKEAVSEIKTVGDFQEDLDACRAFLIATQVIEDEEEATFFSLKQSDDEELIPEWSAFVTALQNRNIEEARNAFEKITEANNLKRLNLLLKGYIEVNKSKEALVTNMFLSMMNFINASNIDTFSAFIYTALDAMPSDFIRSKIAEFNFEILFNEGYANLQPSIKQGIARKITDVINLLSRVEKRDVETITLNLNLWRLVQEQRDAFNFEKSRLIEAKNFFLNGLKIQELFSAPGDYRTFIEHLSDVAYKGFPVDRKSLTSIADFSTAILQQGIVQQPSIAESQLLKYLLEGLAKYLEETNPKIEASESESIKRLTSQLCALDNNSDVDLKSLVLRSLVKINYSNNQQRDEIYSRAADFIRSTGSRPASHLEQKILDTFVGTTNLKIFLQESDRLKEALKDRSTSNPDLLISLNIENTFFSEHQWQQILTSLAGSNAPGFIELIKYLEYQIPNSITGEVAITLINNLNQSDPNLVSGFLTALEKIGVAGTQLPNLLNQFRNIITAYPAHKEMVREFVNNNIALIGQAQAEEFLKD